MKHNEIGSLKFLLAKYEVSNASRISCYSTIETDVLNLNLLNVPVIVCLNKSFTLKAMRPFISQFLIYKKIHV